MTIRAKQVTLCLGMIAASQTLAQIAFEPGDVTLSFSSSLGPPIQVIRDSTGYATFDVALWLNVAPSVKGVTGLDFYLEIDAAGSGLFHINDYTLGTILDSDNSLKHNPKSGQNPTDSSRLATRNGQEANPPLGWVLSFSDGGTEYVGPGAPYQVAQFKIGVSPKTPNGTYKLSTTSDPWAGWADAETFPDDHPIPASDHASIMVTVIPEPGPTSIATVLGLLALAGYRRFAARGAA